MASPQTKVRYQFEAFCKKVINGERCDYLRELMRRSAWESSFSDLPPAVIERIYSENHDPAECYIFRVCGHVIPIRNDRLADALLTFGDEQYSILLLYYSLQLKDREIAPLLGISRSKVQRDRKALFEERLLSYETICAAAEADPEALAAVLRHFDGYIAAMSSRIFYDEYGQSYRCVDQELRQRIENKLCQRIIERFKVE